MLVGVRAACLFRCQIRHQLIVLIDFLRTALPRPPQKWQTQAARLKSQNDQKLQVADEMSLKKYIGDGKGQYCVNNNGNAYPDRQSSD